MAIPVTEDLQRVVSCARDTAVKYNSQVVGTEHLLYGILAACETLAGKLLRESPLTEAHFVSVFKNASHISGLKDVELTPRVKHMFLYAQSISHQNGLALVSTEYILFCMLQDPTSYACNILRGVGANLTDIMVALEEYIDNDDQPQQARRAGGKPEQQRLPAQLGELGVDLTQRAREHKIDPIIGRHEEIERIVQILCRKTKNNPVLIGEPGVGKSAVVEGLSKAIVDGNVPELLKDKIVFSLDIGSLMAGTKYRGALEEKLKTAIDLIISAKNIIVFIDELHTLAQAGSKEGEVTPADILKPYLARGEMQTIGATTTDEYRKFIEKDKALERRFQPVTVAPPSVEETIEILRGLRDNYEAFHKVKISDDALVAAAKLSDRYITDRFLPDKAIDLVDEAMSKAKINGNTVPDSVKEIEDEINRLAVEKDDAKRRDDFDRAIECNKKISELKKKLEESKNDWSKSAEAVSEIGAEEIAEVVSKWTKIPVTKLNETETQRLVHLEDILHERVIGQDQAVVSVAKAIRRARAGLKDANRPIGTFLFLGPTGVGKTELTKALGEAMFDDESAVIRLDMSEYMEPHSVSKLIGAPPGYVGFDDGGQLTEQVRRRPYSVVLFDEIEKAHPDVYNALLQILDDGRLTDSQGRVVSFKNTIVIMTSNVGVADLKGSTRSLGFSAAESDAPDGKRTEEILTAALKRHFKPEFVNRIDVVSIFHHLGKQDIAKIAGLMLGKVEKSLSERGITLRLTPAAMDFVTEHGYDPEYGARPLRRVIEQYIEDNIAEALLAGRVRDHSVVTVDVSGDGEIKIY